jgi:hypothetical protein
MYMVVAMLVVSSLSPSSGLVSILCMECTEQDPGCIQSCMCLCTKNAAMHPIMILLEMQVALTMPSCTHIRMLYLCSQASNCVSLSLFCVPAECDKSGQRPFHTMNDLSAHLAHMHNGLQLCPTCANARRQ